MAKARIETDSTERTHRAFVRAWGLFRHAMDHYFAGFGISSAQWGLLRALSRAEREKKDGLRLTDLGHRMLVRPPSVTALVDRMQRMGLVVREAASDDQRAKLVKLAPGGRRLLDRVLECHSRQIHLVMGGLNQAEQQQLLGLMEKLSAHLETLKAEQQTARGL